MSLLFYAYYYHDVLGKNPNKMIVFINEVHTDNWSVAGEIITVRRKNGQ